MHAACSVHADLRGVLPRRAAATTQVRGRRNAVARERQSRPRAPRAGRGTLGVRTKRWKIGDARADFAASTLPDHATAQAVVGQFNDRVKCLYLRRKLRPLLRVSLCVRSLAAVRVSI